MTADSPLRVALMIGSLREGGAEGQVLELARGLRERGHDARLFLLHPGGPRTTDAERYGVPTTVIGLPKLRPLWKPGSKVMALGALRRTVRELRAFQPDVLHSWLFEADCWAYAAKRLGAPGAWITSRRSVGIFDPAAWKQRLQNHMNRSARLIIANAESVRADVLAREWNVFPERVRLTPNGRDWGAYAARGGERKRGASSSLTAICVANLLPYKGHRLLLAVWKKVLPDHPEARLLLVGKNDGEQPALEAFADALGISDSVQFLGPRSDVPELLAASDLFVLASEQEGLPNAVLEAQACGLAVVATAAGGTAEAILDGETGFVVPVGDGSALQEKISLVLGDAALRSRLGERGAEWVRQRFGLDAMVEAHLQAYRDALDSQ